MSGRKPSQSERSIITEALALVLIAAGVLVALSLATYNPLDPALNVATDRTEVLNLVGKAGSYLADVLLQTTGLLAFGISFLLIVFGIKGFVANRIRASLGLTIGIAAMVLALAGGLSLMPAPDVRWLANSPAAGGLLGMAIARGLVTILNRVGAGIVLGVVFVVATMLTLRISLFETFGSAFSRKSEETWGLGVFARLGAMRDRVAAWWAARREARQERHAERTAERDAAAQIRMFEDRDRDEQRALDERAREERRVTEELVREGLMETPDGSARLRPATPREVVEKPLPRTDRLTPPPGTNGADTPASPFAPAAAAPAPIGEAPLSTAAAVKARLAEARSRRAAQAAAEAAAAAAPGEETDAEPLQPVDPDVAEMISTASIVRTVAPKTPGRPVPSSKISSETGYRIPSTELLSAPPLAREQDERQLEERAIALAEKCKEFSVTGHIHRINPGPVVTTFEFKPDPGIKYSRVVGLADDLCLALKAESIRIDRIPGKSTVGIEVPNVDRHTIFLREIIESEQFQHSSSKLTLALGHTIDGQEFLADLQKMPHLLIAGSTGSGKSVMINAIVTSILYKAAPDEVKFIMVDPKRLELGLYEGIPHLLTPIVVDPKRAANALKWAVTEMENRYRTLAGYGVRNIEQYNKEVRSIVNQRLAADSDELPKPLPYIVVLIDELADLMMVASSEVEASITRLAQMARAIGIHLVLATQRPSVDVITGLIKANFPSRMSFRVSSKVDSRTIIDTNGAEQLLGQGDMLFLPPGTSRLVRVHGSFLSEKDVKAVTTFIKQQGEPEYDDSVTMSTAEASGLDASDIRDELFEDALKIVCDMSRASTSVLQRRLRIGYGRAAAILDQMEQSGFVGPPDGSRPRQVLPAAFEFAERNTQIIEERESDL